MKAIDATIVERKANEPRKFGTRLRDFVGMPTPLEQAAERDKRLAEQIAAHRDFLAEMAANGNARAAEAKELARKAGRLYEPVRSGGDSRSQPCSAVASSGSSATTG